MTFDVFLVGDYWYDLIFTGLPRLPALGHELFATHFDHMPGGAYINATAMHRLGLRVGWACDFGNDVFSRLAIESARREGLSSALFRYHDHPYQRVTAVASFPEDRAFMSYADPAPRLQAAMRALPRVSARVVMVPGLIYGLVFDSTRLLLRARKMKIVMDCQFTAFTLADAPVRRTLSQIDVFMPNAREACHLTGEASTLAALAKLARICPLVVVKDGANGSYAQCGGEVVHEPAIPVEVVDTTGAGDCFSAGFLRAWLDERPLAECLRWGNVCGGLSTRARGGATAAPTLAEVEQWLSRQPDAS
jgi:sugar/nucleoside kinase (ribokinase family)